jgi:hypothetical protein
MLCEQCHGREATVHVAAVSWPSRELTKHLCECCYPAFEAANTKSYSSQTVVPLPIGVEQITASEYLDFCARAGANGADKPILKHICKELERFPASQERLAIEFMTIALERLTRGADSWDLISIGRSFGSWVSSMRLSEYTRMLEDIISRCVEQMTKSCSPPSDHSFGLGLTIAAQALRYADPTRFEVVLGRLKNESEELGCQREPIAYLERMIVEADLFDASRRR